MKKHVMLCVLALALTLCVFAAAQAEGGQVSPLDNLPTAEPTQFSYNPASEEDGAAVAAAAPVNRIYAGATPIPIDPIDMPTPTPRPELTFTFGEYVSTKLGLTFKSAVGYEINENISGKYILTEPAAAVKDNYPCTITLEVSGITKTYSANDLKNDLARFLENEGASYTTWETYKAASKKLMNGTGYYNNYRGVLADGTIVRGRVHMAIISDTQRLTLHISCPGWYNSSYMKIYDAIHSSIKALPQE